MVNHYLIEQSFTTPIGTVKCGLNSTRPKIEITGRNSYENGTSIVYNTWSHNIELITFKQRLPLYNGETVTDCEGWIWRITKAIDDEETLQLQCLLNGYPTGVELGGDPGENLDSISASNNNWTLHIGSEDGETLESRASKDDWMPHRLIDSLGFSKSFTNVHFNGLITNVPVLIVGERIHFHYLTAYDKAKRDTVNTWLAVDEYKRNLENWIGIW